MTELNKPSPLTHQPPHLFHHSHDWPGHLFMKGRLHFEIVFKPSPDQQFGTVWQIVPI
jgi:hypothetical protein